jgi:hypothetical protein
MGNFMLDKISNRGRGQDFLDFLHKRGGYEK